ncbi:MAG: ATP-binding protein [Marinilabiliales bacterium]|nr:MAG: ATP-binding protein [Marinilabiliales bacterium]
MEKKLNLYSKIDNLREVERVIDEISAEFDIATEIYGNILIACLEAVNNAISHGNKLDPTKKVDVTFSINNKRMTVITRDEGPGFDFENVPDPTSPENIENVNGRGIFLMKQLSDEITFHDDGRVSEMVFNL